MKMDLGQIKYLRIQDLFGEMFLLHSLLIYAFDANADNRNNQDIGLNGLSNDNMKDLFIIISPRVRSSGMIILYY
jgi:hypothetical protein